MRINKSKKNLRESEETSTNSIKPFADVQIGDRAVDYAGNVGEVLAKGTAEEMLAYDTTGAMEEALSEGYVDFAMDAIAYEIENDGGIYAIVYGSDGAWVETGMDNSRVYSFAFDFVINESGLSPDEARDRILRDIELVDGIQIVGNPNTDPTSWSREEYGLTESTKKLIKEDVDGFTFKDLLGKDFDEALKLAVQKIIKIPSDYAGVFGETVAEVLEGGGSDPNLICAMEEEAEGGDTIGYVIPSIVASIFDKNLSLEEFNNLCKKLGIKTENEKNLKESEGVPGKYTISYNSYERYGNGELHTKSFSAKDDFDAILKIKKHEIDPIHGLTILIDDVTVYEDFVGEPMSLEDAVAEGDFESIEDYKDYYNPVSSVIEVIERIEESNGDGGDYIFYIKRPDGTYLFKADGVDVDSDWD